AIPSASSRAACGRVQAETFCQAEISINTRIISGEPMPTTDIFGTPLYSPTLRSRAITAENKSGAVGAGGKGLQRPEGRAVSAPSVDLEFAGRRDGFFNRHHGFAHNFAEVDDAIGHDVHGFDQASVDLAVPREAHSDHVVGAFRQTV